ncbi:hypothetical protein AURDEDRAFT_185923 [Auricularia subglabra TFB-10046 SS5]|nr:hypothetical protein AURDEDRAFT_185923 [Auricularia subglabra TFB-10046 SS5]
MPARPDDFTRYMILHRPQTGGCFWCKRCVPAKAELIKPDSHTFARIPTVGVAGCKQAEPLAVPRSVACEDCEWGYGDGSSTYTTTNWWVRGWSQRTQYRDEDE